MTTTTEKIMTQREQIEARISAAQERYDQLLEEAYELPGLLREAQERADVNRAAVLQKRAERELPSELAHARADKLDAMADLEALKAQERDQAAEPHAVQFNAIEEKISRLQEELAKVRVDRDNPRQAAKMHRFQETELRHEARRLRQIHDPRKQEPLA